MPQVSILDAEGLVNDRRAVSILPLADADAYLEKWRKAAVNRVCEAFELVKEAEMEKFGEKSYFYHKINGLPPSDADDDPDSIDDDLAHGFEEEEVNMGALVEGSREVEGS